MFSSKAKILIVDDMSTMRKLIKKSLAELGFTNVVEASDGQVAWEKITELRSTPDPVDLVISDWNMPRMKGIDLLIKIRNSAETKDLPFLLLTAEAEKDQVDVALEAGVSGYLLKPFTKDQLAEKLQATYTKHAA